MKKYTKHLLFAAIALMTMLPLTSKAQAQAWGSNSVHSTVMYTIKHTVTPMVGLFRKFNVEINWDAANPTASTINGTLDASSVIMGMDKLEEHLKSADFFDVATYPEWSFKSTSIAVDKKTKPKTGNRYIATGKLTVKNVTKEITIPFEFLGVLENPRGNSAGFSGQFTINRLDYGVGQDGGAMLGNDVKINVFLEMNPKK